MAAAERATVFQREHFLVRARLYQGLMTGTMSPSSLMRDQAIRFRLPRECIYCGVTENLSVDHIVALASGGEDSGDNAALACRRCNSSKGDRDLFAWWTATRAGVLPLFVVHVYLKQAIRHFEGAGLLSEPWRDAPTRPFDLRSLPETFPAPAGMVFTSAHDWVVPRFRG